MHLADTFIQSDLQCIQAINFFSMFCYVIFKKHLHAYTVHTHIYYVLSLKKRFKNILFNNF